ncbi:MAG: MoaD/ThiS family protein [Gammaproteobacteria bacterium]|nr:MoaD/ThiS family protein [Gammaproteobacteria bacterium]
MNINIEFYASLMKYLPPGKSRFRREVKVDDGITLSNLIRQYNISEDQAHLVLVNGLFVNCGEDRASRKLVEGDVVSIWPPVAGG